jgi:hypothetical protein
MSRRLFLEIKEGVTDYDYYFEAKLDYTSKVSFPSYKKCSTAIRMLAYGIPGDLDELLRMSESTCQEAMNKFFKAVIAVFGDVYLRETTTEDTARLLSINDARGFPRMLGNIDNMHW